jgi:hypothetical protein
MVRIHAGSSTDGSGNQTRVALSVVASSARVVTSKTRQPLAGDGIEGAVNGHCRPPCAERAGGEKSGLDEVATIHGAIPIQVV